MLYFVKNNTLHRYPVPQHCGVRYDHETLRDTVVHGVGKCIYCMHRWPLSDDNRDAGIRRVADR